MQIRFMYIDTMIVHNAKNMTLPPLCQQTSLFMTLFFYQAIFKESKYHQCQHAFVCNKYCWLHEIQPMGLNSSFYESCIECGTPRNESIQWHDCQSDTSAEQQNTLTSPSYPSLLVSLAFIPLQGQNYIQGCLCKQFLHHILLSAKKMCQLDCTVKLKLFFNSILSRF